jgi:LuxR family maltose regulon positive regulatory protein
LYERNDLEGAQEVLSKTIRIGENADRIVNLVRAWQLLACVHQALGEPEQTRRLMAQADELFQQPSPRAQVMHQIEYEYYRLRCLFFQQNLRAVLQWAVEYETRRGAVTSPWAVLNELMYAQMLLADDQPDLALPILKTCQETARSSGADRWKLQSLSLQALGYQKIGDLASALDSLRAALDLAEPEGYIRTFVEYGAPMQHLLKLAVERGAAPGYVSRLLAAFPGNEGELNSVEPLEAARQSLVEPLTDQERSILRLMAAGLSHREIASELYLSINTVKWHTTHIYSKLGVHRRAHAVSRARELNIL